MFSIKEASPRDDSMRGRKKRSRKRRSCGCLSFRKHVKQVHHDLHTDDTHIYLVVVIMFQTLCFFSCLLLATIFLSPFPYFGSERNLITKFLCCFIKIVWDYFVVFFFFGGNKRKLLLLCLVGWLVGGEVAKKELEPYVMMMPLHLHNSHISLFGVSLPAHKNSFLRLIQKQKKNDMIFYHRFHRKRSPDEYLIGMFAMQSPSRLLHELCRKRVAQIKNIHICVCGEPNWRQ